jgi:HAD superfamily hydrolase (TIGR01509 family)
MVQEAVLFDMDGVIIDSHHSVVEFWQQLAHEHQIELTREDFAQHIYGCTANHTLTNLFTHLDTQQRQETLLEIRRNYVPGPFQEIQGVVTFIKTLHSHGIPIAIVTSGTKQRMPTTLQKLGIEECIAAQVTAEDIQNGKPDPACYVLGAQKLNTPPERCIVFEDALSGVRAAVAAGAVCIGVHSPYHEVPLLEVGAQSIIPDFTAITHEISDNQTLILNINGAPAITIPLRRNQ